VNSFYCKPSNSKVKGTHCLKKNLALCGWLPQNWNLVEGVPPLRGHTGEVVHENP
jgi:hypothetical protein